jgi:TolB-like protein
VRGGDLLGTGVNVAARLEGLADAGGIVLSAAAHEQVKKILPLAYTDLGPQSVKNIEEPVRAFVIGTTASASAGPEPGKPLPLPDKSSVAVLPFQNMSGDPEQEYFADGIVEDIITALSRFKSLFVIARNSSFTYKGRAVNIKQVGRELGVRYVLEGSVRKAGGRVRITGQLIEAATGAHLWADKFDGVLEDVFGLQDRVATSVVSQIAPQLILADAEHLTQKPPESWDSYDHYLRGLAFFHRRTIETNLQAQAEFETSISLDPNFPLPYVQAAFCVHNRYWGFLQRYSEEERAKAVRQTTCALELAPNHDAVLGIAAYIIGNMNDEVERGVGLSDRSLHLNPNFLQAWAIKGYLSAIAGDLAPAREALGEAVRLSPLDRVTLVGALRGYIAVSLATGELEEQAAWAKQLLLLNPTDIHGLLRLYDVALQNGAADEANRVHERIIKLYPGVRKPLLREMYVRYRKPEHRARAEDFIKRIAIPE